MIMMKIGAKIRENRRRQGLTLKDLSEKSELSIGLLSQVERGLSSSSIRNIQKIVKSLRISFVDLLNDTDVGETPGGKEGYPDEQGPSVSVVRSEERKKLLMPFGGLMELLAPVHNHKMEFIFLRYPVGAKVKEMFSHEGEEGGLVLEGKLKAIIGEQEFILEAGDSIYFSSTIPHRWENIAKTETIFISAITPPSL